MSTTTTSTAQATQPHHYTSASPSSTYNRVTSKSKKSMSITQTYYLAHKARAKLAHEAAQPDHRLRFLVGHANLLDSLMVELVDAEREQERWFNQSLRGPGSTTERHVQWADKIVEQADEDYDSASDSGSESESDVDDDDDSVQMIKPVVTSTTPAVPISASTLPSSPRETPSPSHTQIAVVTKEIDMMSDDEYDDDLQEDYAQLELVRTPSHANSPPELCLDHDSEESSDEDMPPLSTTTGHPPQYTHKDVKSHTTEHEMLQGSDFYISRSASHSLISAISVC
ncbi:hypothetical protein E4U57_000806 [Claviceps arundinis]|uniref:Uncharacterized protein n=1 Tax=Claviceps arundinis TaxID=1623583 RepID=A0A9P7STA1_9HYPO|nr:hypothetical protein E4U57_000806 [Claviceps arundinis]KAG5975933.1 hypothetical protein E4U56_002972 [Claviceps arundinis]